MYNFLIIFFFQAEDGIRDKLVTGVQTCALPISSYSKLSRRPATILGSSSTIRIFVTLFTSTPLDPDAPLPCQLRCMHPSNQAASAELEPEFSGRVMVNLLPLPAPLSTPISPPCARTM